VKFDCGCQFERLDWDNLNLNCPATWDVVSEGLTKGIFQLEGSLGKRWSKKIKPRSIEELADVISLIRPGCLEAEYREDTNGKMLSITETYVKVKDRELQPEYIDQSLEPILRSTHGVLVYQEQIMEICKVFAGFTLQEADEARRAVGKKIPELMAKVEKKFVESAIKMGRNEGVAKIIFSWIDKFSGYGFNKSHAVGYAMVGYWTAYAKTHFPVEFFKAKLSESGSKIDEFDEIKQLVNEAKLFNIKVLPPSVAMMNVDFAFTEDSVLSFGISHIKGVGDSSIDSIKAIQNVKTDAELYREVFKPKPKKPKEPEITTEVDSFTDKNGDEVTVTTVTKKSNGIKKNLIEALIRAGALDNITTDRIEMLKKFRFIESLTPREQKAILENIDALETMDAVYEAIKSSGIPKKDRLPKIDESFNTIARDLGGNKRRMMLAFEKFHLGMALSGSETELYFNRKVDTTCRDFLKLRSDTYISLGVLIEDVRKIKDKNGNWMAFLQVSDSTYLLDGVVIFASAFMKIGWILEPGNVILLKGKKRDTSLLADFAEHL
jgi:DNA polymerase-3 subunit alpha